MKDNVIINRNFAKAVSKLPAEKRGEAYEAYIAYALDGEEYTGDDFAIAALLEAFKSFIDENNDKYHARCERAKKLNESRSEQCRDDIDTKSSQSRDEVACVSVSDSVYVLKEKDSKESKKKSSAFRRPTVDDVRAYCIERHNSVDPQRFVDFYDSKGWKVGKDSMKDWKACVRTWEQRNLGEPPKNTGITRGTDYDALLTARIRGG